jgi:hypothetical protein
MSFFKKLFGRGAGASASFDAPMASEEHEGFTIEATPMKDGGQYRLAATISKEIDGEIKSHKLIRADVFASTEDCVKFTMLKAKQVIKEQGDNLLS